jgi:hypothetical protein
LKTEKAHENLCRSQQSQVLWASNQFMGSSSASTKIFASKGYRSGSAVDFDMIKYTSENSTFIMKVC